VDPRRLLATVGRSALRTIAVCISTAGLAALVASLAASAIGRSDHPLIAAAMGFVWKIALTLLPAGIATLALMPSAMDLAQPPREAETELPAPFMLAMIALCGVAVFQLPGLVAWWAENRRLFAPLGLDRTSPYGLELVPATILLSMPFVATVALVTFVLTSILVVTVRADLAFRVLLASIALQGGLALACYLGRTGLHEVIASGRAMSDRAPASPALSAITDWIAREPAIGGTVALRLLWLWGAYIVVAALVELMTPRRVAVSSSAVDAGHPVPTESDRAALRAHTTATPQAPSHASRLFTDSNYSVRPRRNWLTALIARRHDQYDIRNIPPTRSGHFSFSWSTGVVQREPQGEKLLALEKREPGGVFSRPSYAVVDVPTGAPIATLKPRKPDWEIVNAAGDTIAEVVQTGQSPGDVTYVARVGDINVCRFHWAMHGLGVWTGELEVEFLTPADGPFDRALGIALAPLLEEHGRLTSEKFYRRTSRF
jgi:hypothetical protein